MTYQLNVDAVDHILTLQQSLAHYERMLSESHPMYLRNLHLDLLRVRAKVEYGTFLLTLVAVMVVPPLVVIGTCTIYHCSSISEVNELL